MFYIQVVTIDEDQGYIQGAEGPNLFALWASLFLQLRWASFYKDKLNWNECKPHKLVAKMQVTTKM
jgi:hypothetical protein